MAWVVWAILAVLLAVGEIFTPGLFFLGPVALAAVVAGALALTDVAVVWQVVAFVLASLASLAVLRPLARAHLRIPPQLRTGTAALEGKTAFVLQRVDDHGGRVRLHGEEWSARSFVPGQAFEPGAQVEVAKIEGATALVYE